MSHSFNKIWIHSVWSTKERLPLIKPAAENQIYTFISNQLRELGCPVRIINGMPDHIHCLFLMNPQKTIAEIVKQIKGSSSHFINQENIIPEKFAWQTGYAAFSVSESAIVKVYEYIENQKQHHQKRTFQKEFEEFLILHNIETEKY